MSTCKTISLWVALSFVAAPVLAQSQAEQVRIAQERLKQEAQTQKPKPAESAPVTQQKSTTQALTAGDRPDIKNQEKTENTRKAQVEEHATESLVPTTPTAVWQFLILQEMGALHGRSFYLKNDGTAWLRYIRSSNKTEALEEQIVQWSPTKSQMAELKALVRTPEIMAFSPARWRGFPAEVVPALFLQCEDGNQQVMTWEAGKLPKSIAALYGWIDKVLVRGEKQPAAYQGTFSHGWRPASFPYFNARLYRIAQHAEAIVVGKLERAIPRTTLELKKWTLEIQTREMLKGALPARTFSLQVDNPALEFLDFKRTEELEGRFCVYAMTFRQGEIDECCTPFVWHQFKPGDLAALRELVVAQQKTSASEFAAEKLRRPLGNLREQWELLEDPSLEKRMSAIKNLHARLHEGMEASEAIMLFPPGFFRRVTQKDDSALYVGIWGNTDHGPLSYQLTASQNGQVTSFQQKTGELLADE